MPKWIQLHDIVEGGLILINTDNIEGVFAEKLCEYDDTEVYATHIDVVDGTMYQVSETYDEVRDKLTWQNGN